jgi:hypothetical protein
MLKTWVHRSTAWALCGPIHTPIKAGCLLYPPCAGTPPLPEASTDRGLHEPLPLFSHFSSFFATFRHFFATFATFPPPCPALPPRTSPTRPPAQPRTRELHTGLSPDKFALCSPRTGHPGKKNWQAVCPVAGTPTGQIRTSPDRTSSARPFPDRSAMAEAGPSGAHSSWSSSQAVGRRRRVARIVAGRAPKSSQAARQKGCRAPSRCSPRPRPIASPQGPRGRASQTPPLRRGRACTAGCSGLATSAARGAGTPCCSALLHQVRGVYGSKWCDGPGAVMATATDLTAHAGSKVHLAALQHVATRLGSQGIVASMGRAVGATQKVRPNRAQRSRAVSKKTLVGFFGLTGNPSDHVRS